MISEHEKVWEEIKKNEGISQKLMCVNANPNFSSVMYNPIFIWNKTQVN